MIKTFVFDTNSLISAYILTGSKNRLAYNKAFDAAIKEFRTKAFLVNVDISISNCGDPKDNKFLELAIGANASCIITGDKDLLVLHPFRGIPILTAVDFLNNF